MSSYLIYCNWDINLRIWCFLNEKSFNFTVKDEETECYERIYRKCTQDTDFTDKELENVRLYVQKRFLTEPQIKPVKPACDNLYVKKDFKCMTHEERMSVINVFKEL